MRPNRLRTLMREGQPTLGVRLHSTWPGMVEAIGHTRTFDYIEFLGEYAPFDLYALDNICRAAELFEMSAIMKVDFEPKRFLAQRAIGSGFSGVLFADCRNRTDGEECIRAIRPATPTGGGVFGSVSRRFAYMAYGGNQEYVDALSDVVAALMIENQSAVEHLDKILELEGLDLVQFGPVDYALSIGRPGESDSEEVRSTERHVIDRCLQMGIDVRAEIEDVAEAERYLELGVRHFAIGTDLSIVHSWCRDNGLKLRAMLAL